MDGLLQGWSGLILAFAALVSGPLTVWLSSRGRKEEEAQKAQILHDQRQEDILRADELIRRTEATAARVEAATKVVADRALADAELLRVNTEKATEIAKSTGQQVIELKKVADITHLLVNSQLSAAKQAEFNAISDKLVAWKRLVEADLAGGVTPVMIKEAEEKLAELRVVLDERAKQATLVTQTQLEQKKVE